MTTSPNGAVHRSYYEPFGGRIGFNGIPNASSMPDIYHGFTGHPHDDALNLIDMGGRIYSPSTRQFLTPDPLGRLGASPYSYVRNNPLNWIDPTGFTEEEPEGTWYSGFSNLFSSVPILAVNANPTLIGQLTAVAAAMDLPNGNDAPNSSGCPDGTGTAPRPCAAPGEAGCSSGESSEIYSIQSTPGCPTSACHQPGRLSIGNAQWTPPARYLEAAVSSILGGGYASAPTSAEDAADDPKSPSEGRKILNSAAFFALWYLPKLIPKAGLTVEEQLALHAAAGTPLALRVEQIHRVLHPVAQRMRTTAALDTTGARVVAGGGPDLTPAQRALLRSDEIGATLPGAHAEVTALTHAQKAGLTPRAMAVTRTICEECSSAIETSGGRLTGPTTAEWP